MKLSIATSPAFVVTADLLAVTIENVDSDVPPVATLPVEAIPDIGVTLMTLPLGEVYDVLRTVLGGSTRLERQKGYDKAHEYYASKRRTISRPEVVALLVRNISFMHQWKYQSKDKSPEAIRLYFFEHLTFVMVALDLYYCATDKDSRFKRALPITFIEAI